MKNWYKSAPVKGVLLLIQHVLVVLTAVSIMWLVAYPGLVQDIVSGGSTDGYAQSEGFGQQVFYDSQSILQALSCRQDLETDGQPDQNKLVDIEALNETGRITGTNDSGLAYTVQNLTDWDKKLNNGTLASSDSRSGSSGADPDSVIVCRKPDGTYEYYYYKDFKDRIDTGELSFMTDPDLGLSSEEILGSLQNATLYEGDSMGTVVDQNNQVVYRTVWNYDGFWLEEGYAPEGADSLLDIVNQDPRWNGRLSDAYTEIKNAMDQVSEKAETYQAAADTWTEGNTNLTYIYADTESGRIYTNRAAFSEYDSLAEYIHILQKEGSYVVVTPTLAEYKGNIKGVEGNDWRHTAENQGPAGENFIFAAGVNTEYPVQDSYYNQNLRYEEYAPAIRSIVVMGILAVSGILVILVWLTVVAGRRVKDSDMHLNFFDGIKTELAALVTFAAWLLFLYMGSNIYGSFSGSPYMGDGGYYYPSSSVNIHMGDIALVALIAVCTCGIFMIGYLSLVRRIKAGTLWKNSLLRWILRTLHKIIRHFSEVWQIVTGLILVLFFHFFLLAANGKGPSVLLVFGVDFLVGAWLIIQAVGRRRLGAGIDKIAAGEVDYKIPLEGLKGGQKDIAEKINTIGEGLDAALEASMKNERLKTDLITNVSHDIKTPLTSIINYVDLLKRENFEDPKIRGYLDILEAKAQRLKTLTEDVVEASKVSSGNITLECMDLNLVEMIQQTSGEFAEKFQARNLTEVLSLPEQDAVIHADGRRMWRVLENIFNNAAKYAMEGTRIYGDLTAGEHTVSFSLKNISEQQLNIRADELTERFIRGDVSRSTEGSGLGLSIAKSLTEMQGGTFTLYLDGDLFKVTLTFPRVIKE